MKVRGKLVRNPHEYRGITLVTHTASCGAQVRSGLRRSMPSRSIESCARVRQTVPSVACGQISRPRSRRLANRHKPSPSHHKSFTMSPLRPRKTKTCPENGCCSSTVCTFALRPSKSGKRASLLTLPPLRTGHESFPSSGSSRCKAPYEWSRLHDGLIPASWRWMPNFLWNARSAK